MKPTAMPVSDKSGEYAGKAVTKLMANLVDGYEREHSLIMLIPSGTCPP